MQDQDPDKPNPDDLPNPVPGRDPQPVDEPNPDRVSDKEPLPNPDDPTNPPRRQRPLTAHWVRQAAHASSRSRASLTYRRLVMLARLGGRAFRQTHAERHRSKPEACRRHHIGFKSRLSTIKRQPRMQQTRQSQVSGMRFHPSRLLQIDRRRLQRNRSPTVPVANKEHCYAISLQRHRVAGVGGRCPVIE